jgi:cytoskeletal protein RodZ
MLLKELSRNKKAGLIIVALGVIYIISKNFLFRTILGRLLLVVGLVATTNCNKALGLGLLILICLACSQMSNDFENFDNKTTNVTASTKPKTPSSSTTKSTTTKPLSGSNSDSTTKPTTTEPTSPGQDAATIQEKMRKIATGKDSNTVLTSKTDSKDVLPATALSGTTGKKESFLNYSSYNQ